MDEPLARRWLDPGVLARLGRQQLRARFPMEGTVSGLHKSPHRGSSVEFAEYRRYTPGDDLRRLDWRVYGRTDRFYIREFEADTNLRCYLVLDASGSMGFGEPRKLDYARRMAATLAYLLIQQGDAVGLYAMGAESRLDIPPRRHPAHMQPILEAVSALKPEGGTGLARGLHDLAETIRRRALVILFSDLFCEVDELIGALRHLRFRKHDVALVHLLDRQELDFAFDRPMRFLDLERQDSLLVEPAVVRRHYMTQLERYLTELSQGCLRLGVECRRVVTDQDYEAVLAEILVERAHGKGARV